MPTNLQRLYEDMDEHSADTMLEGIALAQTPQPQPKTIAKRLVLLKRGRHRKPKSKRP